MPREQLTPEQIAYEIKTIQAKLSSTFDGDYKKNLMRLRYLRNKQTQIKNGRINKKTETE